MLRDDPDEHRDGSRGMKERANAWAIGDVDALAALRLSRRARQLPRDAVLGRGLRRDFATSSIAKWLSEAEHALATYDTSFSVLPMRELVAADGVLAQLAARGYTVTAP